MDAFTSNADAVDGFDRRFCIDDKYHHIRLITILLLLLDPRP